MCGRFVKRVGPGDRLKDKRIGIIVANEFEDVELLYPFIRLSEEGAEIIITVSYTHLTLPTKA